MLSSQQDPKSPYLKSLPEWLELDYHRRIRRLRRLRKWVTFGLLAACTAWAVWTCIPGHQAAQETAPVSTAHAGFNSDCARCHTESFQPVRRLVAGDAVRSVPDAACLACHDGPPHPAHHNAAPMPACATCHREHRGHASLAHVADGHCTDCHKDLKAERPTTKLGDVTGFDSNHPEFLAVRPGQTDPGKLKFNHAAHLGLDLKAIKARAGPDLQGLPDRLDCSSCHEPDAARRYMKPINYEQHCQQCHPLHVRLAGTFESPKLREAAAAFGKRSLPHREPEVVRGVLRERLVDFIQRNPVRGERGKPPEPARPFPGRGPQPVTEDQWSWVKGQMKRAEDVLFVNDQMPKGERLLFEGAGGCRQCHNLQANSLPAGGLPVYEKPQVPERWFPASVFSHDSHRMLQCTGCHEKATTSTETRDVLMPSIQSCRECHNPRAAAPTDCTTCHGYHDHSRERNFNGPLTIQEFLRNR